MNVTDTPTLTGIHRSLDQPDGRHRRQRGLTVGRVRTFWIGGTRQAAAGSERGYSEGGFRFTIDPEGWIRATSACGSSELVPVIGGQADLSDHIAAPEEWGGVTDATGHNTRISDGKELYAGVGFKGLVQGQVENVLWALDNPAHRRTGRLLELGCGPGFLLAALERELPGWEVLGIDPSPVSVEQAAERGVTVLEGTLDSITPDGRFEAFVVMGNFQLHYDPAATLRRLAELAVPGARLYLDSKNPRTLARAVAWRAVRLRGVNRWAAINAFAAHAFHGMRHGIPQTVLTRLLKESGWDVVQMRTSAPRLLRFGNRHSLAGGAKGLVWRALDGMDRVTGERAWIQVAARRQG
jgi:SAM-dependent methyltransferase